jgi:hypothetical protein
MADSWFLSRNARRRQVCRGPGGRRRAERSPSGPDRPAVPLTDALSPTALGEVGGFGADFTWQGLLPVPVVLGAVEFLPLRRGPR